MDIFKLKPVYRMNSIIVQNFIHKNERGKSMRMHDKCLPCIVNQAIKVANITGVQKKEELLREVFTCLSKMTFKRPHQKS